MFDQAGFDDPSFWKEASAGVAERKGFKTDLESTINVRNVLLRRVPDNFEVYKAMQRRTMLTLFNFGDFRAQKLFKNEPDDIYARGDPIKKKLKSQYAITKSQTYS